MENSLLGKIVDSRKISLINICLFILIGLLLCFGQILRISLFQQLINIYAHEFLMILLITFNWKKSLKIIFHQYSLITLGFILASFIVNLDSFTTKENIFATLYTLRLIIWFIWIWLSSRLFKSFTSSQKQTIKYFGLVFALSILTSSILQYFFYPTLVNFSSYGWDPHTGRIFGVMFDTGAMAIVLILISIFIYHLKNFSLIWLISLITIIATFSRSSYITLVFVLISIKKIRKNIIFQLLFASIFVIFVFTSFQKNDVAKNIFRTFSIISRIDDQKESLVLIKKNWLTGVGIGRIRYVRSLGVSEKTNIFDEYAHHLNAFASSWLTVWTWLGTIAMVWVGYLILIIFQKSNNIQKLTLSSVFIMSIFDNILFQSLVFGVMGWFFIIESD